MALHLVSRQLVLSLFFGAVIATSLSAQKIGEVPLVVPGAKAPKGQTLEGLSAEEKPFWYRLPKKINAKRPPALIVMLHGTGGSRGWAFWNYGIDGGQFRPDDIVVAPTGMTPGQGKTFNFVQSSADGDQIAGIIKQFRRAFPIGKVYLYGHSQGAFFCYWFGGEHPDLIDGYVAHAGNVLQVKHPKLAKRKLAVAILHGKADAVVGVECAHRTHKIYREEGYRKLKLEIVEGLNERSGHWPLPKQVKELFAWLDQQSADTPLAAREAVEYQLNQVPPDLSALAESSALLAKLLKKYRGDDREELLAFSAKTESDLDERATKFATDILSLPPENEPQAAARFRILHPAFASRRSWQKAMRTRISKVKREEKAVAKQIATLSKKTRRKSLLAAAKVFEKSPHASNLVDLARALESGLQAAPKGMKKAESEGIRALLKAHRECDAETRAALFPPKTAN